MGTVCLTAHLHEESPRLERASSGCGGRARLGQSLSHALLTWLQVLDSTSGEGQAWARSDRLGELRSLPPSAMMPLIVSSGCIGQARDDLHPEQLQAPHQPCGPHRRRLLRLGLPRRFHGRVRRQGRGLRQALMVWILGNFKCRTSLVGHTGVVSASQSPPTAPWPRPAARATQRRSGMQRRQAPLLPVRQWTHPFTVSPKIYWLVATTDTSIKVWDL